MTLLRYTAILQLSQTSTSLIENMCFFVKMPRKGVLVAVQCHVMSFVWPQG